ncbi:MAG: hypothetical protein V2A72_00355 [Candidatus Omnitrophota bacterium]
MRKGMFLMLVMVFTANNLAYADTDEGYINAIKEKLNKEPGIRQVQLAAIEYAEVSPDKIVQMREQAKSKAWLPKLGLDFGYDTNNNIDIDRGGTNDRDVFINGPDDEDWDWGASLNWDLGELVWNPDQTTIDLRSKYMVCLRKDILEEVTKLYFERQRLIYEIIDGMYKGTSLNTASLRLDELTARIDALTGGFLSKNSK